MNVSLKGTDCLQKRFDDIFILSDKVAFMSGAALFTAVTGETACSTALKAPPAGRESVCIFNNKPVSSNMLLLLLNFCFLQQLRALFILFILAEAHLFHSIRIISPHYHSKVFWTGRFLMFFFLRTKPAFVWSKVQQKLYNFEILLFKITAFNLNIF